jgi:AGCS family alanine or glycine:cation symporter
MISHLPCRLLTLLPFFASTSWASELSLDDKINDAVAPATSWIFKIIFFTAFKVGEIEVPFILIWLAGTAIFLTVYFKFINVTSFGLALRTVRGKYSKPTDQVISPALRLLSLKEALELRSGWSSSV